MHTGQGTVLAIYIYIYSEAADLHAVSKTSVCVAMEGVLTSICNRMDNIHFPSTDAELRKTKTVFYTMTNCPNVIGAIDGTLIKIIAPN